MKRAVVTVAGIIATLILLWGILHVMISPINPDQASPKGHFGDGCAWCHIVTHSAELTE